GDELFRPRQHGLALVGEHELVRTAVVDRPDPRAEIAVLETVEHRDKIWPQDSKRARDLGLVAAGIAVEQEQDRELRRRQLQRRHAAQKILENLELRT